MIRRRFLASLAAAPVTLVAPQAARADHGAISAQDNLAIGGADPVAYFIDGTYLPGRPENALMWRGAVWLFDRTETVAAFEMDPMRWCPQFGGYCAFAMSHGMLSHSDPRVWLLHEGELYLCNSTLAMLGLRRDLRANLAAARANWPAVLDG